MLSLALAVKHLPREAALVSEPGLYWVSLTKRNDMLLLAASLLTALPANLKTTLVCADDEQDELLAMVPDEAGPDQISLFSLAPGRRGADLKWLTAELGRSGVNTGVLLLLLPATRVQMKGGRKKAWALSLQVWASRHGLTMLVLCHGQEQVLPATLAGQVNGLLRLERNDNSIQLRVDGWRNALGLLAGVDYELLLKDGRFAVRPASVAQHDSAHNEKGVLIQRAALEHMPAPAADWQIMEPEEDFWQKAITASEGTLVAAVESNEELTVLAQRIHSLRRFRGPGLRLAIRKLYPCLREVEQDLLLQCGANLVIPSGVSHAQFLSLLHCLPGQRWQRPSVGDIEQLLRRFQPPAASGLLSPREFYRYVDGVFRAASGEIPHQLLALPLRLGLNAELCLSQFNLRRQGDLACLLDDSCYLFLFACPDEAREAALANAFHLPWQELFSECRPLFDTKMLPRQRFEQDQQRPALAYETPSEPAFASRQRHFGRRPFYLNVREQ
ncbi:cellulose biosynthesis protein BcsE [Oceanisphaera sediminis]|uniref:Cellulose biosynthesis protein BcsE n=1 Tax=Oceanisphaera sediminis TaxID=981381 RepID=A0ABP7EPJ5_9GAMM